jgi:hypothetical protein
VARWPVAQGRVLSAKVEKYRESVSRGTGGPRDRMTLYRPVLLYEDEVAGKRFRGSRIAQSPGLDRGVPEFAEKVVERYPDGSAVAVRYNPKRPMNRCWNSGCLAAGYSELRSVSRCWCWRPTLIIEGGKTRRAACAPQTSSFGRTSRTLNLSCIRKNRDVG